MRDLRLGRIAAIKTTVSRLGQIKEDQTEQTAAAKKHEQSLPLVDAVTRLNEVSRSWQQILAIKDQLSEIKAAGRIERAVAT